jgi:hypothetical protein
LKSIVAGAFTLAFFAPGNARAQELLTNPGFETGSPTPWTYSGGNLLVTSPDMASS